LKLRNGKVETIRNASARVYEALGMNEEGSSNVFKRFDNILKEQEIIREICGEFNKTNIEDCDKFPENVTKMLKS
jgi:hypothetical protein